MLIRRGLFNYKKDPLRPIEFLMNENKLIDFMIRRLLKIREMLLVIAL